MLHFSSATITILFVILGNTAVVQANRRVIKDITFSLVDINGNAAESGAGIVIAHTHIGAGTVCGINITEDATADMICNELGYNNAVDSVLIPGHMNNKIRKLGRAVVLSHVHCHGDTLSDCTYTVQRGIGVCNTDETFYMEEVAIVAVICEPLPGECKVAPMNGFLKERCQSSPDLFEVNRCANNNDKYYSVMHVGKRSDTHAPVTRPCENNYQGCGLSISAEKGQADGLLDVEGTLCGTVLCLNPSSSVEWRTYADTFPQECADESGVRMCEPVINQSWCDEVLDDMMNKTTAATNFKTCDMICQDTFGCFDEHECNGYLYGMYCRVRRVMTYLKPSLICDRMTDCDNMADERDCSALACRYHSRLHNGTRCAGLTLTLAGTYESYCENFSDQLNCTDPSRGVLRCTRDGYQTTVSSGMLCLGNVPTMCDDHLDKECVTTSSTCTLHKHLTCNGVLDCTDGSDEAVTLCRATDTCDRRYKHDKPLPIPTAWLNDGVKDCVSGKDELFIFPKCDFRDGLRSVPINTTCTDVYLCDQVEHEYLELSDLCDGIDECGEESVCNAATSYRTLQTDLFTTPIFTAPHTQSLAHCLPGLSSLQFLAGSCQESTFRSPDYPVFGTTPPQLNLPINPVNCNHVYGAVLIFLSCMGVCEASSCPLHSLKHDSCANIEENRIHSLAWGTNQLTLVSAQKDTFVQDLFLCDNNNCVTYDKVCNTVNDCGDFSDESICNNFQCTLSQNYIDKTKKCDGTIDCKDFSDECNEDCGAEIISGIFLKGLSWFLGLSAVLLNLMLIWKGIFQPWKKGAISRINRSTTFLIAVGDLLTGLYLLLIAFTDSFVMREGYCIHRFWWLSSNSCAALGAVNTIGSYMSLLSMTYLSLFRTASIKAKGLQYEKCCHLRIAITVVLVIAISAIISLVPLVTVLEDTFVNGLVYDEKLNLFSGSFNKQNHMDVINAYYGKISNSYLSWKEIEALVAMMFTQNYGHLTRAKKIHFYGNEGVCLFKYFVKSTDPQRYFVWGTLAVNITCFLIISLSYIVLQFKARKSSRSVQILMPKQSVLERKTDKLQRNITLIILTDFICWIPFILTAFLHIMDIIDATFLYSFFSIVLLPVNSVINPILYDDFIKNMIYNKVKILRTRVRSAAHVLGSKIRCDLDSGGRGGVNTTSHHEGVESVIVASIDTVSFNYTVKRRSSVEMETINSFNESKRANRI